MRPLRHRHGTSKLVISVAVFAAALSSATASAQPPADTADPFQRYQELGVQAAKADEDLLEAQGDLEKTQREKAAAERDLAAATTATTRAQQAQNEFREQVDEFAAASFNGGQLSSISAVLTSDSTRDFLDQLSALDVLAADKANSLRQLGAATDAAEAARARTAAAQQRAQKATAAAQTLLAQVRERRSDLEKQIEQVRGALNALAPAQRTALGTVQDSGSYAGPPGAANEALQAALSRRGSEYEWGATGPAEFDCSGLTSWAYRQAGITIPRTSRQQYGAGKQVSLDALQPGDLLFYDDGTGNPGTIHHVGMYVGEGKMVDAPTEGQVVDVRSMRGDGHLMGARRIAG